MIIKTKNIIVLLVRVAERPAGQMEKDGKQIHWDERIQISVLPFQESKNIMKYSLSPIYADKITRQLESVHWGCLIELEFEKREVISVNILSDVLKDFYEENIEL